MRSSLSWVYKKKKSPYMNCTNFPHFLILLLPLSYRLLCQLAYFYLSMWYLGFPCYLYVSCHHCAGTVAVTERVLTLLSNCFSYFLDVVNLGQRRFQFYLFLFSFDTEVLTWRWTNPFSNMCFDSNLSCLFSKAHLSYATKTLCLLFWFEMCKMSYTVQRGTME